MNRVDDPIFEALEPRILLSGSPAPDNASDEAVHVDVENESNVEVQDSITEILFVDSGVDGYDKLIEDFDHNAEVIVIPEDANGVDFITSVLEKRENLTGVHIFSHGDKGEITLGNTVLSENNVAEHKSDLQAWAQSLSAEADILIYGCNFGQSDSFLNEIAALTDSDIAASDNLTGDIELGGDADLEVKVGEVQTNELFTQAQLDRNNILLAPPVNTPAEIFIDNANGDTNSANLTETGGGLTVSESLSLRDDKTGSITLSVKSVAQGGTTSNTNNGPTLLAMFSVNPSTFTGANTYSLNWTFNSNSKPTAFDYLDAGQTLELTYTLEAKDSNNAKSTFNVIINIAGVSVNSAPVISPIAAPSPVAELGDASAQDLAAINGSLTVQDSDVGDSLTASIVGNSTVALAGGGSVPASVVTALGANGNLTLGPTLTSDGNSQSISYSYDPVAADLDFLQAGDSLTVTYTLVINDGTTDSSTQDLVITITGTNDGPQFSAITAPTAVLEESDASAQDLAAINGSLTVQDSDVGDSLTASIVGSSTVALAGGGSVPASVVTALGANGNLTLGPALTSDGNSQSISYSYDPVAADLDFLQAGDSLTVTYTLVINDGTTDSSTQDLVITITGTNDKPIVSAVSINAAEDGGTVNGTFSVIDEDSADTHTFAIASQPSEGSVVLNGPTGFTFDPGSDFQDLAAGETRDVTFTYIAIDDSGTATNTSDPQTVTITVTGVNDAPALEGIQSTKYSWPTSAGNTLPNTVSGFIAAAGAAETTIFTDEILEPASDDGSNFAYHFTGSIEIETAGTYTFETGSDDGSLLLIDGTVVVDNNGAHGFRTRTGTVNLSAGTHTYDILFFERGGSDRLTTSMSGPDTANKAVRIGNVFLPVILETDVNNNGALVSDLVNSRISDVDTSSSTGIAITEIGAAVGTWQFSLDNGANWQDINVSSGALHLDADARVRMEPDGNNSDNSHFVYHAWDQTDLLDSGDVAVIGATGGSTAYSEAFEVAQIAVSGINNAPIIDSFTVDDTSKFERELADSGDIEEMVYNGRITAVISDADNLDSHTYQFGSITEVSGTSVVNLVNTSVTVNSDGRFSISNAEFNEMRPEDTVTVKFTYFVQDDSGTVNNSSGLEEVTVTITGTNDSPFISNGFDFSKFTWARTTENANLPLTVAGFQAQVAGETLLESGKVSDISESRTNNNSDFAYHFSGQIFIETAGDYTFQTISDDGSLLFIDDNLVVDNNGLHGSRTINSTVTLTAGVHDIDVTFFERTGGDFLATAYSGPDTGNSFVEIGSYTEKSITSIDEDNITNIGTTVEDLLASSDEDDSSVKGIAITELGGSNGKWQFKLDGSATFSDITIPAGEAFHLGALDSIRFLPDEENGETTHIVYHAWDQTNLASIPADRSLAISSFGGETAYSTAVQKATILVSDVNDTPIVDATADTGLTETTDTSDIEGNVTVTFSDVDLADTGHAASISSARVLSGVTTGLALNNTQLAALVSVNSTTKNSGSSTGSASLTFTASSTDFDYLGLNETVTLEYTVSVSDGDVSATNTFNIVITGTNDQPVASAVSVNASEDGGTVDGSFVVNDADATDTHTFVIDDTGLTGGSVTNNDDGTFTFDPGSDFQDLAAGESRNVSFTYTAVDDSGVLASNTSDPVSVTITVTGTNDQPVASAVSVNASEDGGTVDGSFVVNDADATDTHTFVIDDTGLTGGSVTNNDDGTFTFDPGSDFQDLAAGESRNVSFTYTAVDDSGVLASNTSDPVSVTITVTGTNDQPVASAVSVNASEDGGTVDGSFVVNDADATDTHTFVIDDTGLTGGSVTNNDDGTFTFDPGSDFQDLAAGESRNVSFTYTAVDDSGVLASNTSDPVSVTITVTGTNDQPVASAVSVNASEDGGTVDGSFVVNDADATDTHTFVIDDTGLTGGSVTNNDDGTFTFDPGSDFQDLAAGESRNVSFTYTAVDDSGVLASNTSDPVSVTITVTGTNDQPVASAVSVNASEDGGTVDGSFVVNDADATDTHTFVIDDTGLTGGSVTNNDDGTFTFDPGSDFQDLAAGESRNVSFTYTAVDDSGVLASNTSDPVSVTITVTGTNDQPVASAVSVNASEDGGTVDGSFVVNDADATDTHTFVIDDTGLTGGSVTNNDDGTFTFDPGSDFQDLAAGESRNVSFTYTAVDDSGVLASNTSDPVSVTITVTGTNDQPVASAVSVNASEDGGTVDGSFVVNDADATDTHTFVIDDTGLTGGSVTNNDDGTFTFDPGSDFQDLAAGESRNVSFTYTAVDDSGVLASNTSDPVSVTITVTGTNDQPVASAVSVNASEDGGTVDGSFVVNDADATDTHTFVIDDTGLTGGSVTNNDDGTFTFDPGSDFQDLAAGESRNVSFTYTAVDDSGVLASNTSDPVSVTITVTGTNDQPVASAVSVNASEDGGTVDGSFVVNDADATDTHTFVIDDTGLTGGSVTNNDDGTFTFDPGSDFQDLAAGESRNVSFTYTAVDDSGVLASNTSDPVSVTITVTGTNDQPVASAVSVNASEDGGTVDGSFVVNDADATDTHTFVIDDTGLTGGSVTNNDDGTFTFDPGSDFQDLAAGESRNVSFTYTAVDDSGVLASNTSDPVSVTITVTGTNDQPVASAVSVNASEDGGTVDGSFVVNDADATDTHTFVIDDTGLTGGSVTNNDDGTFTFDPGSDFQDLAAGESRNVSFTYTAVDDSGVLASNTSDPVSVTITVTGTNDQPVASAVSVNASEDGGTVDGSFVVNDADATDTHTFVIDDTGLTGGSVTNNDDGTFTFDPGSDFQDLAAGESRNVSFTYTAVDDSGVLASNTSDPVSVTITVTGTNDQPVASAVSVNASEDGGTVDGSFVVNDADATDTHTFVIDDTGLTGGSVTNNDDGTFTFDPGSDFQDLAAGESRNVSFTYTAVDDSGVLASNTSDPVSVTITVTGTNGQPVASAVSVNASEDGGTVDGSFVVNDADATDTHTFVIDDTGLTGGSVTNNDDGTFTFDPGSDFQDLAAGESRNVSFTYTAVDDSGVLASNTSDPVSVTITVTGTNDQPVASAVSVNASEDGGTVDGSFVVNDADATDTHTFVIDDTGLTGGSVTNNDDGTFTFDPGSDFQDLAAGESRNVSFTYTAVDDSGVLASNTSDPVSVTITVTGTNDQPDITIETGDSAAETLTETDSTLSVNGTLTATDVDIKDAVSVKLLTLVKSGDITGLESSDLELLNMFTVVGGISDNSDTGVINWSFNSAGEAFDYLTNSQSLTLTYTVEIEDPSGEKASRDVTVTISGTNDSPIVSEIDDQITEDDLAHSKDLLETASDLDNGETLSVQNVTLSVTGPVQGAVVFTVSPAGVLSLDPGQFSYLAEGTQLVISFTYDVVDSSGVGIGDADNESSISSNTYTLLVGGLIDPVTVINNNNLNLFTASSFGTPPSFSEGVYMTPNNVEPFRGNSLNFVSGGSSLQFEEESLAAEALGVVSGIFDGNVELESEVADTGNVEQEVKDKAVYDKPQLPQEDLQFIEDLIDEEDEEMDEEELSFESSDESMHELEERNLEPEETLAQKDLDRAVNLEDTLIGEFDCFKSE